MEARSAIMTCWYTLLVVPALLQATTLTDHKQKVQAFFQGACDERSPCEDECIPMAGGFICDCHTGYRLQANGFSCNRIINGLVYEGDADGDDATYQPSNDEDEEDESTDDDDDGEEPDQTLRRVKMYPDGKYKEWGTYDSSSEEDSEEDDIHNMMLGDQPGGSRVKMRRRTDSTAELELDELMKVSKKRDPYYSGTGDRKKGRTRTSRRRKSHRRKTQDKSRNRYTSPNPPDMYTIYDEQSDSAAEDPIMGNNVIPEMDENEATMTSLTPGPTAKYQKCDELVCKNGGKCVADSMRVGVRCQCKLGTGGEYCEIDVTVRYPQFLGTGYIAFPVLRGAYKDFTFIIEFRPETGNGLVMFSGEYPNARADFFSISLVDGYAEFRFDCGTGMGTITTENRVMMRDWNTLTVHRRDWDGHVQLNDGLMVKGRSRGMFSRITFREDLYLGGYRNTSMIGARTGMTWGFVGCVRRLNVNNKEYDMRKGSFVGDAIHGVDVGECSTDVCTDVKCQNGGTCIADSADTSMCLCPLGVAGDRCESRIDIHVPAFNGNSYLQFFGLRRTVLSFAEIELVIKPTAKDGLILYNGYTTDRTGDFISLSMRDGYLEFRFDLGTGPAIVRTRHPISLNEWHDVRLSRTGRDGTIQVDKEAAIHGMSKGGFTQLTLTLDLFIGGHRNFDEVAQNANADQSFKGCIQKLVINERPMKLLEEALGGVNVDNCDHPCVTQPCLNGGRCVPMRDLYKCSCPLGFENTNCEDRVKHYARLKRQRWLGLLPDPSDKSNSATPDLAARESVMVPMFTGDSYLEYSDHEILKRLRGRTMEVQLWVRSLAPTGLIMWAGESSMGHSSDYMAIGLRGGHAQFSFNLGDGEVVMRDKTTRIDDGFWHKIQIERVEKVGMLTINGTEVIEGTAPGKLSQLTIDNDKLFLGGMDDIVHKTLRKFKVGLTGCVANVTIGTDYRLDLINEAKDGRNIKNCS